MRVFDRKFETMARAELEQFQLERLQAVIARLRRNVRRYRDAWGDTRVESLADLARLPVTEPRDLIEAFPYGMFALPLREVIRLHSTVGPGGEALVIGHTRNDLTHWGRLVARQLVAAGVTANDVIQICFDASGFEGAFGYMRGAETIEASVIPEDPYHVEHQLAMLQNYRVTVLIASPTNAEQLADLLADRRIEPESLGLRTVLLSRPVPAELRERLRAGMLGDVQCSFGIDDILNPGLCVECPEGHFHVNEDHFLVETREGELVVTTLYREAMPLVRCATRVSCEIKRLDCPCGRTGAVLVPGQRLDDQVRVNEIAVYPAQMEQVLEHTRAAQHAFTLDITDQRVVVSLQVTKDLFADTMRTLADLKHEIESAFHTRLGIAAEVRFVEHL